MSNSSADKRKPAWIYPPPPRESPALVSVILPVLNEIESIDDVFLDLLDQDYPGSLEVVVADGGSTDGTMAKLIEWKARDLEDQSRRQPRAPSSHRTQLGRARADGIGPGAGGRSQPLRPGLHKQLGAGALRGRGSGRRTYEPGGRDGLRKGGCCSDEEPTHHGAWSFSPCNRLREEVDTVFSGHASMEQFEALGGYRLFRWARARTPTSTYRWRRRRRKVFCRSVHRFRLHAT